MADACLDEDIKVKIVLYEKKCLLILLGVFTVRMDGFKLEGG